MLFVMFNAFIVNLLLVIVLNVFMVDLGIIKGIAHAKLGIMIVMELQKTVKNALLAVNLGKIPYLYKYFN